MQPALFKGAEWCHRRLLAILIKRFESAQGNRLRR